MRRISLAVLALVCIAGPALAYDPCLGPRQSVKNVQIERDHEAKLRADFASGATTAPVGAEAPPDRDAELAAEQDAKEAIAAACGAVAGQGASP